MSTIVSCPDQSLIAAWLSGEVDEDVADSIGDHVDGCETCMGTTTRLESSPNGIAQFLQAAVAEAPREVTGPFFPERYPRSQRNIGEYRILERLGGGGMGSVFVAIHGRLRRSVALKVLAERSANDQRAIARFNREMEVVGRLNHPNIVQALDAGEADGTSYLAMELLNGADLSRVLAGTNTLSVADATEIARQAALGLNYAHDRGMIHRDVKPSNMMLARENDGRMRVKILDLGLAIIQESAPGTELTDAGQLMGTLEYMAPEQTEDTHSVDHTADIYALGSTIYRMLVGHVPFSGDAWNTPAKRLNALMHQDAPAISESRSDLPTELSTLIDSMLRRNPAERPQSMRNVAESLLPFSVNHDIASLPGMASAPSSIARTDGIHSALIDTQQTAVPTAKPVPFNWMRLGLIVAACLIVLLLIPTAFAIRSWMKAAPPTPDISRTDAAESATPEPKPIALPKFKASKGLVGLWGFEKSDDGLSRDLSGHGLHGTMAGSPAIRQGAPIRRSRNAQPVGKQGGSATITHQPILNCSEAMTIGFWLRQKFVHRKQNDFIEKNGSFVASIVRDGKAADRLVFKVSDSDDETSITSKGRITRSWRHFAVTYDGDELKLYVNGQLDNTLPITHGIATTDSSLTLGSIDNSDFAADLDEVCLFDRALSEQEVISLTRSRPAPALAAAPFGADHAVALQNAWADYLELPVEFTNGTGITMRLIPAGKFQMGLRESEIEPLINWHKRRNQTRETYASELPNHWVQISQPFYFGIHEVTQQEYATVTGETPGFFPSKKTVENVGEFPRDEFPIEQVSWNDCTAFCNGIAKRDGLSFCYDPKEEAWVPNNNPGYRLPTEAEWEYACRAGTESMWSYGEREDDHTSSEWVVLNSDQTTRRVGQLQPNAFGLYDMHGNVFEWCEDWYDADEYNARAGSLVVDPTGPEAGTRRVYRGGSWWQRRTRSRSSARGSHFPGFSFKEHGFRVVLDVAAAKSVIDSTDAVISESRAPESPKQTTTQVTEADHAEFLQWFFSEGANEMCLEDGTSIRDPREMPDASAIEDVNMWIPHTSIPDKYVRHIANLKSLRFLKLTKAKVTDAQIEILTACPNLKRLSIGQTHVTDKCVPSLLRMKSVTYLSIEHTSITEAGLLALSAHPQLEIFAVEGIDVSPEIAARIRAAMPDTNIRGLPQFADEK